MKPLLNLIVVLFFVVFSISYFGINYIRRQKKYIAERLEAAEHEKTRFVLEFLGKNPQYLKEQQIEFLEEMRKMQATLEKIAGAINREELIVSKKNEDIETTESSSFSNIKKEMINLEEACFFLLSKGLSKFEGEITPLFSENNAVIEKDILMEKLAKQGLLNI